MSPAQRQIFVSSVHCTLQWYLACNRVSLIIFWTDWIKGEVGPDIKMKKSVFGTINSCLVAKESILYDSLIILTVYLVTAAGRSYFARYRLRSPTWDPFLYHGFNQNFCVLNSNHNHVNQPLKHDLYTCYHCPSNHPQVKLCLSGALSNFLLPQSLHQLKDIFLSWYPAVVVKGIDSNCQFPAFFLNI